MSVVMGSTATLGEPSRSRRSHAISVDSSTTRFQRRVVELSVSFIGLSRRASLATVGGQRRVVEPTDGGARVVERVVETKRAQPRPTGLVVQGVAGKCPGIQAARPLGRVVTGPAGTPLGRLPAAGLVL